MAQNEEREKIMKEQNLCIVTELDKIDEKAAELLEESLLLEQRKFALGQIQECMENGHQWKIGDVVSTLTQLYSLDLICICCKAYIPMCSPNQMGSYAFDRIIHAPVKDDGTPIFAGDGDVYMAHIFPEGEEDE